jgi:ferritin-like metal-binding protein YciE
MATETLQELYLHELRDAHSAEQQILKALPKMEEAAANPDLRHAFSQHRQVTEEHVRRLEQIMTSLDEKPKGVKCKGMEGILDEGEETLKKVNGDAKDAALASAAQRVEHYEMAVYGALRTYANRLGRTTDASLLQRTLDEEGEADKELTRIAESGLNQKAMA